MICVFPLLPTRTIVALLLHYCCYRRLGLTGLLKWCNKGNIPYYILMAKEKQTLNSFYRHSTQLLMFFTFQVVAVEEEEIGTRKRKASRPRRYVEPTY